MDVDIASGMFAKTRTGQYPSPRYLGTGVPVLKSGSERFDTVGRSL